MTVTFTSSVRSVTVTVTATDDAEDDDNESVGLRFATPLPDGVAAGPPLTVSIVDNDGREVLVSALELRPDEGDTATYEVELNTEPTAAVTVAIAGWAGTDLTVDPVSLDFTPENWDEAQTVTVTAGADDDSDQEPAVTLLHTASGGDYAGQRAEVEVTIVETGTPMLRITGAAAPESAGEIVFEVRLSRPFDEVVEVEYETSSATSTPRVAVPGRDYTAASGTLTFPADSMAPQEIRVSLLDDEVEEAPEETFTVTLRNPSAGTELDPEFTEATGTIRDDDGANAPVEPDPDPEPTAGAPAPEREDATREWLVRSGWTATRQVVDVVGARLEGSPGSHVTVGGYRSRGPGEEPAAGAFAPRRSEPAWTDRGRGPERTLSMTARDLLLASSFHLGSPGERAPGRPLLSAWGRFARSGFRSEADGMRTEGDVTTGMVGADAEWGGRWLAGAALSTARSEGSYAPAAGASSSFARGEVESRLNSILPYVRMRVTDELSLWALAGYGSGELTLTEKSGATEESAESAAETHRWTTDIDLRLGSLGARGTVFRVPEWNSLELAVRSDALVMRMESDAVAPTETRAGLAASEVDASRVRLLLEGSQTFELPGGTLHPSVEIGLRRDGGDAEKGVGLVAGAGARYTAGIFSIEGSLRTLVAHEESGYEEWGASGSIRVRPRTSGRGLSLTLAPAVGAAPGGAKRLWSARDATGLAGSGDFEADGQIDAEIGFGLGFARAPGVVTPFAALSLAEEGARVYRIGTRWRVGPATNLALEGNRRVRAGPDKDPVNAGLVRAEVRW